MLDRGDDLNGDGRGDGGRYFIDPTPDDYSEFNGNIANAFAGGRAAQQPRERAVRPLSLVAAELTHVLGINSGELASVPHDQHHYSDTNIPDTAEGGGVGTFWVYDSPTMKPLMTSTTAAPGGSDRNKPLHGAGPAVPIAHNGLTWEDHEDSMNAMYEFGRGIPGCRRPAG